MKRILFILFVVVLLPVFVFHWLKGETSYEPFETGSETETVAAHLDDEASEVVGSEVSQQRGQVDFMIDKELRIRQIEPVLKSLSKACENLELLSPKTRFLFASDVEGLDVVSLSSDSSVENWLDVGKYDITLQPIERQAQGPDSLWTQLITDVRYFEFVKFYAVSARDKGFSADGFSIDAGFEALGRTKDGWRKFSASGEIAFKKQDSNWLISRWSYDKFDVANTGQRLFREATAEMFSPDDYSELRRSVHFEILLDAIARGGRFKKSIYQRFFPRGGTTGRHPSLAVADVDGDGWDDLYVVEQWRENMFFRNLGDGTFKELGKEYGLDVDGWGTSGIFADFDNDGDEDLFLGRSFARSMYLENVDGKFVDRTSERFTNNLPYLATAVSVVDYNNDGLLDIYVSTYGLPAIAPKRWVKDFLTPEQRLEYINRLGAPDYQRFVNAPGPPNVLYENRGNKFVVSRFSQQVQTWANSFQGSWSDFDGDGDQDLYVANDFARDYLFRNDQADGFKDVTFEVGDETMTGFGMGAAWGDYDEDGQIDLYVSNMFSKAGMRITQQFEQLDQRFQRSADGNRLYRNDDGQLKLVSANSGTGIPVHKAGWSWGGQFLDVNNDGFLDLYVCSGYFTAPQLYATEVDL